MTPKTPPSRFPWADLAKGQSFFVPTLALDKTRAEGLRAALPHRLRSIGAQPAIYRGMLGVMFTRR